MNGTTDKHDDESNWDLLASELGLEPAPTPKLPKSPTKPEKQHAAAPDPVEKTEAAAPIPEAEVVPEAEAEDAHPELPVEEGTEVIAPAELEAATVLEDTVLEEGPELLDDEGPAADEGPTPAGEAPGEGGGRKRRRRRRRKKGSPETAAGVDAAPAPEADEEAVAEPVASGEDELSDEIPAMVDESALELEDDEESVAPHAAIEELEDESTEPLPEWKVMAWTDLLATLYRPQDR